MLEIICEAFGAEKDWAFPDLANGGGVAQGRRILSVQLRCVVVQVQSLDGHHHPGHLAGIVCREEEGEMSLVKLGDTLCNSFPNLKRSGGHNEKIQARWI